MHICRTLVNAERKYSPSLRSKSIIPREKLFSIIAKISRRIKR